MSFIQYLKTQLEGRYPIITRNDLLMLYIDVELTLEPNPHLIVHQTSSHPSDLTAKNYSLFNYRRCLSFLLAMIGDAPEDKRFSLFELAFNADIETLAQAHHWMNSDKASIISLLSELIDDAFEEERDTEWLLSVLPITQPYIFAGVIHHLLKQNKSADKFSFLDIVTSFFKANHVDLERIKTAYDLLCLLSQYLKATQGMEHAQALAIDAFVQKKDYRTTTLQGFEYYSVTGKQLTKPSIRPLTFSNAVPVISTSRKSTLIHLYYLFGNDFLIQTFINYLKNSTKHQAFLAEMLSQITDITLLNTLAKTLKSYITDSQTPTFYMHGLDTIIDCLIYLQKKRHEKDADFRMAHQAIYQALAEISAIPLNNPLKCHFSVKMIEHLFEQNPSIDLDACIRILQGDTCDSSAIKNLFEIIVYSESPIIQQMAIAKLENDHQVSDWLRELSEYMFPIYFVQEGSVAFIKTWVNTGKVGKEDTLHSAIRAGRKDIVNPLIEEGVDVNSRYCYEDTPLLLAIKYGEKEIALMLMTNGADVNAQDSDKNTSLILAIANRAISYDDRVELVKALIHKGADVNHKNQYQYNPKFYYQNTPLLLAIKHSEKEIALMLMTNGADVNAQDSDKNTSLILAIANRAISYDDRVELVKALINKGTDVNVQNNHKEIPLIVAASFGDYKIVEMLIHNRADYTIQDNDGYNALMIANEFEHHDVAKLIEQQSDSRPRTHHNHLSFFGTAQPEPRDPTEGTYHRP